MSCLAKHPDFYNYPIRLSEDEKEHPYEVLESFFADHSLAEVRQISQEMAEICLTTDEVPFNKAEKRADLILYQQKIEDFFEAALVIVQERQKARRRRRYPYLSAR